MSCSTRRSTFAEIEREFQALTTGPRPLAIEGYEIDPGLPDRAIPLNELRTILLSGGVGNDVKSATWSILVQRARQQHDPWTVACAGVMLPGLRRIASSLTVNYAGDIQHIEGEIVLGFLETLHTIDPGARAIPALLWWSAKRRGAAARTADIRERGYPIPDDDALAPRRLAPVGGHPDLVLARAVSRGVVTPTEADLVSTTRIGNEPLDQAARRLGLTYAACRKRRSRAEERLLRFLGHPTQGPVAERGLVAA